MGLHPREVDPGQCAVDGLLGRSWKRLQREEFSPEKDGGGVMRVEDHFAVGGSVADGPRTASEPCAARHLMSV